MDNRSNIIPLVSAFAAAYHNVQSDNPIIKDEIITKLISGDERRQIESYIFGACDIFAADLKAKANDERELMSELVRLQLASLPMERQRFCEEALATAARSGTTQYVVLGAGLDTYAWRQPDNSRLQIFEVDTPQEQETKRARLERAGLKIPDNLHFVPCDFLSENLGEELAKAGFKSTKRTFFSLLGVCHYLDVDTITKLMTDLSHLCTNGSSVCFDVADNEIENANELRSRNMVEMAKARNASISYTTDEFSLMSQLEDTHFMVYEYADSNELNERYFADRDDGMTAFEHISMALAVMKDAQYVNTKERILDVSLMRFSHDGYEAVSVKDIADDLSITKGALYRHYKSKRDIFDTIVRRMQSMYSELNDAVEHGKNAVETACGLCRRQFEFWTGEGFAPQFRRMMTLEQYRSEEMSGLYAQYFTDAALNGIAAVLEPEHKDDAVTLAFELYSPLLMLFSIADNDRKRAAELLEKHLTDFSDRFTARKKPSFGYNTNREFGKI